MNGRTHEQFNHWLTPGRSWQRESVDAPQYDAPKKLGFFDKDDVNGEWNQITKKKEKKRVVRLRALSLCPTALVNLGQEQPRKQRRTGPSGTSAPVTRWPRTTDIVSLLITLCEEGRHQKDEKCFSSSSTSSPTAVHILEGLYFEP